MKKHLSLTVLSVMTGVLLFAANGCIPETGKDIRIQGRVLDQASEKGLADVEIFIEDGQLRSDRPIAETSEDGGYTLHFVMGKADTPVISKRQSEGVYRVQMPRIEGKTELLLKFVKSTYEEDAKSVSLMTSQQTLRDIKLKLKGLPLTVIAYKVTEGTKNELPFPDLTVFYALDDEDNYQTWLYPTDGDGKCELSVPGTSKLAKLQVGDDKNDNWIPAGPKVQTAKPRYGSQPEVKFIFHEARTRTLKVTCIDDQTEKPIAGVRVRDDSVEAHTDSAGTASLVVAALPATALEFFCTYPEKYYDGSTSATIVEGQDDYSLPPVRLRPKTFVAVKVTDTLGEPAAGVKVFADEVALGQTDARGEIPRNVVRALSLSSTVRIDSQRYQVIDSPQISRPNRDEPNEYQINIPVQFISHPIDIITLDKESNEEIKVDRAFLLSRDGTRKAIDPLEIHGGEVHLEITHPTQRVELHKRRYISLTVPAVDGTQAQMTREAFKVFVNVKNQGEKAVNARVKIGAHGPFNSTELEQGKEGKRIDAGRYDITVTPADTRQYAVWNGYGIDVRPTLEGDFVLDVTLMENHIGRAKAALKEGDYGAAAIEYDQYIKSGEALATEGKFNTHDDEYIQALFKLGEIYGERFGDRQGAVDIFEKVVKLQGDNAMAYYRLGVYAYLIGNHERARQAFRSVIANERGVTIDARQRTRYYAAMASYRLYEDDLTNVEYKHEVRQYCLEFKQLTPENQLQQFRRDIDRIYRQVGGK